MKMMRVKTEGGGANSIDATPPPPPPPPMPMFKRIKDVSVTNREIANFWRRKRMEEEDHLLAAIKAAARIRARKFTDEEYKRFEESLNEDEDSKENDATTNHSGREFRVGMKDWWTKSKYAYLNQPAVKSMDSTKRRTSTYIPNFYSYKPAPRLIPMFSIF